MWNYRIIKDKKTYGLYEVMYNDNGEICAHSEEPEIIGESPQDLLETLELMAIDVNKHIKKEKEILEYNKIKFHEFCDDLDKAETITLEEFDKIIEDLK
jgi:hypothetical protein